MIVASLFLLLLGLAGPAYAYTDGEVIRAIIGEASDQGDRGMLAVACAIRNRDTLSGVNGIRASHIDFQPEWVWHQAREAWAKSAEKDIVKGSDHWENITVFGVPSWAVGKTPAVIVGDHAFYNNIEGGLDNEPFS